MSKIGKINISIPEKVNVALNGSILNVDGALIGGASLKTEEFKINLHEKLYNANIFLNNYTHLLNEQNLQAMALYILLSPTF